MAVVTAIHSHQVLKRPIFQIQMHQLSEAILVPYSSPPRLYYGRGLGTLEKKNLWKKKSEKKVRLVHQNDVFFRTLRKKF